MNAWIKLIAGALLFALWGALVFMHQADPKDLVVGIAAALTGLGVFHATTNGSPPAVEPYPGVADLATQASSIVAPAPTAQPNAVALPQAAATAAPVPAPTPIAAAPAAVQ